MIKKIIISTIILYFLAMLETSFFVHFNILNWLPNTLLLYIIIFNILESPKKNGGIYISLIAGFFSDIFSSTFIGFNIIIFLIASLLVKFVLTRYVRIPFFEKT